MATATYRPASDSSVALSQFGSGTGNYGRVNEVTEDATNGVYAGNGAAADKYGFGLSNLGTLNSVTVYARCFTTDLGAASYAYLRHNDTNGSANVLSLTDTLYSYTFTTSLAWTDTYGITLVGNFYIPDKQAPVTVYALCTQHWIVVDYTAASTGNKSSNFFRLVKI
jgi:hypothetical protein